MGADKYKVEQNGKFLGYYPAHNEQQAVEKAYKRINKFTSTVGNEYTVSRHGKVSTIYYEGC